MTEIKLQGLLHNSTYICVVNLSRSLCWVEIRRWNLYSLEICILCAQLSQYIIPPNILSGVFRGEGKGRSDVAPPPPQLDFLGKPPSPQQNMKKCKSLKGKKNEKKGHFYNLWMGIYFTRLNIRSKQGKYIMIDILS